MRDSYLLQNSSTLPLKRKLKCHEVEKCIGNYTGEVEEYSKAGTAMELSALSTISAGRILALRVV